MRRILRSIGSVVFLAAAVLGLRRATLALGEWFGEAIRPGRALWRAGGERGEELLRAAAYGLVLAVLLSLATRAGRAGAGRAGRVASSALALALVVCAALGLPGGTAPVGLEHARGALELVAPVLLAALVLVAAASLALSRAQRGAGALLVVLTLGCLLGASALELGSELCAPTIERTEIVRMLPMQGGWQVVSQHPEFPPEAGVIAPVPRPEVDGQDLPSLVMPPPCELRFLVRPQDDGSRLHLAAGIDASFVPRLHPQIFPPAVLFEVKLDGEVVYSERVDPVFRGSNETRAWRWVGGEEGLALRAGQEVRLRTALISPETPAERTPRIPAGFGRVRLEKRITSHYQRATPERPNLVFILQDTLRADRMSCYGFEKPTTPAVDALAARGLLYENAYSASSWTWPSTASMLTGLWPEVHQVVSDGSCYLATDLDTLAEVLSREGYVSAAFVGNPLILPQRNFDQGFHLFRPPPFASFRKSDQIAQDVEGFLDRYGHARFFLYLHLVDVHWPYELLPEAKALIGGTEPAGYPPEGVVDLHFAALQAAQRHARGDEGPTLAESVPPERIDWAREQYAAAVATGDHWVGEILASLARRGLDEDTVIVFTSDHGEELFDHGLGTHGHALWEELVRVPLVIAGPGVPVGRVRTPVSNRHVGSTLARLGGTRLSAVRHPLDLARPETLEERPVYFSTEQGWWEGEGRVVVRGLREGPWSILHLDSSLPDGRSVEGAGAVRLFDLTRDPHQREDLTPQAQARVDELLENLHAHVRESEERRTTKRLGAGLSTRKMLQAIGYTGDEE